jgi:hypothetical protein
LPLVKGPSAWSKHQIKNNFIIARTQNMSSINIMPGWGHDEWIIMERVI